MTSKQSDRRMRREWCRGREAREIGVRGEAPLGTESRGSGGWVDADFSGRGLGTRGGSPCRAILLGPAHPNSVAHPATAARRAEPTSKGQNSPRRHRPRRARQLLPPRPHRRHHTALQSRRAAWSPSPSTDSDPNDLVCRQTADDGLSVIQHRAVESGGQARSPIRFRTQVTDTMTRSIDFKLT